MQRRPKPRVGLLIRSLAVLVVGFNNAFFKRRWCNVDGIPAEGPTIVAANHVSHVDPVILAQFVWDAARVPRYLAKASLFNIPVIGWVIAKAAQIPVERGSRDASTSLAAAAQALRAGELVVVYPEGTVTRDPDFWPMSAKTGLARLALLVPEATVIPVGQWGAQNSVDVYHKRYRPFPRKTVTISAGEPVDLSKYAGGPPTTQVLREITNAVMVAVRDQVAQIRGEAAPAEFARRPASAG
jgi:1-acyl-sn-glycerol-3-phosphate acyltransferase